MVGGDNIDEIPNLGSAEMNKYLKKYSMRKSDTDKPAKSIAV